MLDELHIYLFKFFAYGGWSSPEKSSFITKTVGTNIALLSHSDIGEEKPVDTRDFIRRVALPPVSGTITIQLSMGEISTMEGSDLLNILMSRVVSLHLGGHRCPCPLLSLRNFSVSFSYIHRALKYRDIHSLRITPGSAYSQPVLITDKDKDKLYKVLQACGSLTALSLHGVICSPNHLRKVLEASNLRLSFLSLVEIHLPQCVACLTNDEVQNEIIKFGTPYLTHFRWDVFPATNSLGVRRGGDLLQISKFPNFGHVFQNLKLLSLNVVLDVTINDVHRIMCMFTNIPGFQLQLGEMHIDAANCLASELLRRSRRGYYVYVTKCQVRLQRGVITITETEYTGALGDLMSQWDWNQRK
jgi:hypothetical protein